MRICLRSPCILTGTLLESTAIEGSRGVMIKTQVVRELVLVTSTMLAVVVAAQMLSIQAEAKAVRSPQVASGMSSPIGAQRSHRTVGGRDPVIATALDGVGRVAPLVRPGSAPKASHKRRTHSAKWRFRPDS